MIRIEKVFGWVIMVNRRSLLIFGFVPAFTLPVFGLDVEDKYFTTSDGAKIPCPGAES